MNAAEQRKISVLLVVNPKAGNATHRRPDLEGMIRATGADVRSVLKSEFEPAEVSRGRFDRIVVAGGDGTVASVLRKLPPDAPPVSILPLGTANNVARSLGLHQSPEDLITTLRSGRPTMMNVGQLRFGSRLHRFVESAGLGLMSTLLQAHDRTDSAPQDRIPDARRRLIEALHDATPFTVRIAADDLPPADHCVLLAEFSLIGLLGPNLGLASNEEAGNGRLQIVRLDAADRQAMISWLENAGGEAAAPVSLRPARRVKVESGAGVWHRDDKLLAAEASAELCVEARHVTIWLPG